MRKLIMDMARWIFVRCGGDPVELGRNALCSISPRDEQIEAVMGETALRRVYNDCRQIMGYQTFGRVLDDLVASQRDLVAKRADERTMLFARGTLNGIQLVRDRFSNLAAKKGRTGEIEFDKFKAI